MKTGLINKKVENIALFYRAFQALSLTFLNITQIKKAKKSQFGKSF